MNRPALSPQRAEIAKPIPYGRQTISDADIEAVAEVLRSDYLTQGPAVQRFEQGLTAYCGVNHATAVANATAALHIACLALDLGPGDRLWTTPNTFVASANCGRYCGADVDFVDIDPRSYNISVEALETKLRHAETEGKLPKVVVPVDFSGRSCDMAGIAKLAKRYGFRVIEDASHAIGGEYLGKKIGSCAHADISIFSFHPVKIVTTGEGGAALTNDDELGARLAMLRTHGITRDPQRMEGPSEGAWYYEQTALGFNYRITDIQAALGASQLTRLDEFVERRRYLANRYDAALADLPLVRPRTCTPETQSAWHLYVVCLKLEQIQRSRREVFNELRAAGILVNVHYIPVHLQPYYQRLGFRKGDFPASERYYDSAITLPMFYSLTEAEQDYVVATLRAVLR